MDKFFNGIQKTNQKPTADPEDPTAPEKKAIPKGVVLGKDGKPCVQPLPANSDRINEMIPNELTTTPAAAPAPPSPPGPP